MSRTARRWVIVAVLVILVIGVLAAVLVSVGGVQVPDVTGKTQADATKALEDAGLKVGEVTSTSDAEAPAGTVVRQDPAAGTEVDDGSTVVLAVSSGPGTAAVPDVVGMDRAEAEGALADAGFVPASAMQYDVTAPAGQVVQQLPAAGDEAAAGSQVGLLVSKGRPEVSVSVPDVTGMTQDQATTTLADAGLVAVPVEAYVAGVPAGDVAEQEPAAGDRVSPLSEVLVTVSLGEGATSVAVPDVVGKTQAKATSTLEAAGLAVTTAKAWSPDVAEGVVIAQEPKAGVKVEEGGDAGILVSLGVPPSPSPTPSSSGSAAASPSASPSPAPPGEGANPPEEPADLTASVPDVVGMDAAQAEAELEALGLRPVPLEAASATAPVGTVFEQLPAAGAEVPKTYPVFLLISTGAQPQVNPL
jgi:beta-lactam-binding protein with PASTA domain